MGGKKVRERERGGSPLLCLFAASYSRVLPEPDEGAVDKDVPLQPQRVGLEPQALGLRENLLRDGEKTKEREVKKREFVFSRSPRARADKAPSFPASRAPGSCPGRRRSSACRARRRPPWLAAIKL